MIFTENCYLTSHFVYEWIVYSPIYVGDNYVHRLSHSKTNEKLVELNSNCVHVDNGCWSCYCEDNAISEAILDSKVKAIMSTCKGQKMSQFIFGFLWANDLFFFF